MRHILAYSGGIASAYCIKVIPHLDIVYFNDTKWEHPDLYRFNRDIEKHFCMQITEDSDGRDPEQLAFDRHGLPSNRMPFCSVTLKAQRLQRFAKCGDTLYFGILDDELPRAARIRTIYAERGVMTEFPLIQIPNAKQQAFDYFESVGIEKPMLYKMGFDHNNCSGGCVRAGKRSWARLWHLDPETYEKRAAVERRFNEHFGTHYSFIRDCTLDEFVPQIKKRKIYQFDDDGWQGDCIGLCSPKDLIVEGGKA